MALAAFLLAAGSNPSCRTNGDFSRQPPLPIKLSLTVLQVAISFRQVRHQQMLHQRLRVPDRLGSTLLLVKALRELDFALEDLLVDGHGVLVVEGVDAGQHLVDEDAQAPPVDRLAVACGSPRL